MAENRFNSDNFAQAADMKVFIDMGHDTIKACRVTDDDWTSSMNHFEIPTVLLKELSYKQRSLLKTSQYDFDRKVNTNFKFFKNNIDNLLERVLSDDKLKNGFISDSLSYHQRPMVNGLIQSGYLDDFEFIWEDIGKMFIQSFESQQDQDQREQSWDSLHSRLLMTDPSLTMAANDARLIKMASTQRSKIAEIAFESLGVTEFSLLPAQLPQMFSELCMDGIVVDCGHEQTQIVPIFGGMVDIRKVHTFPVGGITMDSILMKMWRNDDMLNGKKVLPSQHKFTQFRARTKFKEELRTLNSDNVPNPEVKKATIRMKPSKFYILPDNEYLEIDFQNPYMRPINAYLDNEYYRANFEDTIKPLIIGRTEKQLQRIPIQRNFVEDPIYPVVPPSEIKNETLHNKIVEGATEKFPVTNVLFKTMREYCEDEEIKEFELLKNIIITGGGANISHFNRFGERPRETLGSLLVNDFKRAISAESVTGLKVHLSMDARLSILQGAKILMNLSSDQNHYVSSHDYFEAGSERVDFVNQILL